MLSTNARPRVLADAIPGAWVRDVLLVAGYAATVGLAAQIAIPLGFTPVPISGQTFAVLLGAAALGWRRSLLGMLLYAAVGLAGAPWFAQGHGGVSAADLASLGYVAGFIVAAGLVGWLAERRLDRRPLGMLLAMVLGNLVIYGIGVPWLMVVAHLNLAQGLLLGVVPFLLGDAIKTLLACGLLPGTWRLLGTRRAG